MYWSKRTFFKQGNEQDKYFIVLLLTKKQKIKMVVRERDAISLHF